MKRKRDYYEVLHLRRDAREEDIKKSYRQLALKYHPDRNPGDDAEDRFKEATEAYEVLVDPRKRRMYDYYGHAGVEGAGSREPAGDFAFSSFENFFDDFFGVGGRSRSRRHAMSGADLLYDLTIRFHEAAFGVEKEIEVPRSETCIPCNGSGVKSGYQKEACRTCGGRGRIYRTQGFVRVAISCPNCMGSGEVNLHPCDACRGLGRVQGMDSIRVNIPPGVKDGMKIRLSGKGEPGRHGGPPGDLFIRLQVEQHEFFERQGDDIVCRVPVSFVDAALGTTIEVATLDGSRKVRVRKGTQPGDRLILPGKGIPRLNGRGRGDQVIIVDVKTPTRLSRRQEKLLKEFRELGEKGEKEKSNKGKSHPADRPQTNEAEPTALH